MNTPQLLTTEPLSTFKKIRGICLDIDDTLSTEGKLTDAAYSALWDLKRAGFAVVPVTGRPAGWCDHISRFWPVDAVVGENGAFTFYLAKSGAVTLRKRLDTLSDAGRVGLPQRLNGLREKILKHFPEATFASDQGYREYDLAIDVAEDVPVWPVDRVQALLEFCRKEGAHAKLSSIHVNTWYGDFDKRRGFDCLLQSAAGKTLGLPALDEWIYVGDSPNDEPMFEWFKASVGVANLKKYLKTLSFPPRWLTHSESGNGFAELARTLIDSRTHG